MAVEPPYDNYCAKIAEEIAQMLLKICCLEGSNMLLGRIGHGNVRPPWREIASAAAEVNLIDAVCKPALCAQIKSNQKNKCINIKEKSKNG